MPQALAVQYPAHCPADASRFVVDASLVHISHRFDNRKVASKTRVIRIVAYPMHTMTGHQDLFTLPCLIAGL